ncbi:MAG: hypothetical protein FJ107_07805 [Deltaproteobacteria bacterium]|nr:hypothetical protein [Deltaproteobacteria bacterium]
MIHLSLSQQRILLILALFLLALLYFKFYHLSPPPSEKITKEIAIEVQGEIRNPGIYIFKHPPTLKEAIEKAGGLIEKVSLESKSFSVILETGALINIQRAVPSPLVGEVGTTRNRGGGEGELIKIKIGRMEAHKLLVFNIPLDLNRVSVEDLCLIPGIGESLAGEIVMYRERRKGFRSVEELLKVKRIGDKKYQSLKNFFIVGS